MYIKHKLALLVIAAPLLMPSSAKAAVIGYCLVGGGGACQTPGGTFTTNLTAAIATSGNTSSALTGLAAGNLTGIDVLWVLNSNNGDPGTVVTGNTAAISDFVSAGHVLSFHDRNVNQGLSAATYLPGGGGIAFTSAFGATIDIVTSGTLVTNGPGGVLTNTSLDGGNSSFHGYASLASLPGGAIPIFSTGNPDQIVDFYYTFGLGGVYYSAMPLDFYLNGSGNNPPADAYRNIYAANEAAFQAGGAVAPIPEPGTFALISGALLGLGLLRRRK